MRLACLILFVAWSAVGCGRESNDPPPAAAPVHPPVSTTVSPDTEASANASHDSELSLPSQSAGQASSAPAATAESKPAFDDVPAFLPLQHVRLGDFVLYRTQDAGQLRYEVIEATKERVLIRTVLMDQKGKRVGMPATREETPDADLLARQARRHAATRRMSAVDLTLAGRSWLARLYEDRWTDEGVAYVRRTWVSPDAPVFGLLRMELRGDDRLEASLELVKCSPR